MDLDPSPGATPSGASGDPSSFRFRRRHQKSRKGCLECKKRHMKCDETRPRCLNCTTVERTCSYKGNTSGQDPDVISRASSSGPEKERCLRVENDGSKFSTRSSSTLPGPTPPPYQLPSAYPDHPGPSREPPEAEMEDAHPYPPDEGPCVNMVHMDLFHHFITSAYGFVAPEQTISRLIKDIAVKHAITAPFLMHQLLAFSARHRSSVSPAPEDAAFFRHVAVQLQTHAISLFGRVDMGTVSLSDRVSIFLFSSFLGIQDLCEALSLREERFEVFLARYLGYIHLHRGVHKVIKGSLELLKTSELKPVLDAGGQMAEALGMGEECDDLSGRIEGAEGLSEEEKDACRVSIRHLQVVFDSKPDIKSRVTVLLAWAVMSRGGFVKMLEAGREEALCVLGYYFVLLHFCKNAWFVAGSGEFLLGTLETYLGPEWEGWMRRPRELLKKPWS